MNTLAIVLALALALVAGAGALAIYRLGVRRERDMLAARGAHATQRGHEAAAEARASGKSPEQIARDNDGAWQ